MERTGLKKVNIYLVIVMLVLSAAGCAGKYAGKSADGLEPIDLTCMYDEINGYHIPGLTWDMKKKDVEDKLQASLGKASQGLEKTYYLENDDIEKIDGYVTSNVDYAFTPKGTLVNVTCNFYIEDYTAEELDDFYEHVKEELMQNYGAADDENEAKVEQGRITFYTKTCKWEKKLPDGRISSLQIAKADKGEAIEVVSVGATIYSEEEGK